MDIRDMNNDTLSWFSLPISLSEKGPVLDVL